MVLSADIPSTKNAIALDLFAIRTQQYLISNVSREYDGSEGEDVRENGILPR